MGCIFFENIAKNFYFAEERLEESETLQQTLASNNYIT